MSPTTRSTLVTATVIAVVTLVADFLRVSELGPLADDWAILGDVGWYADADPAATAHDLFFWSWNARPMRAVSFLVLAASHAAGGLVGMHAAMALVLIAAATTFARLTARRLGDELGLAAGLILVLHPADTTHVWSAAFNGKVGLLAAILACAAFARGRTKLAAAGCVVALLTYELSVLVFALAPWFRDGGSRRSLGTGALAAGAAGAVYAGWRLAVYRVTTAGLSDDLSFYGGIARPSLRGYAEALPLFAWRWPARLMHLIAERGVPERAGAAAVILALLLAALIAALRRRPLGGPAVSKTDAASAVLWGVIGIVAGCLLAGVITPTLEVGTTTRYNVAALPGAALLATAALAVVRVALGRAGATVVRLLVVAITVGCVSWRLDVQADYVAAARYQRRTLREFVDRVPDVGPHTVVVIRGTGAAWSPPGETAAEPFVTGIDFEMTSAFRALYDRSVLAVVVEDSTDLMRLERCPAGQAMSAPDRFHDVLVYDADSGEAAWVEPRLRAPRVIAPRGPALEYLARP